MTSKNGDRPENVVIKIKIVARVFSPGPNYLFYASDCSDDSNRKYDGACNILKSEHPEVSMFRKANKFYFQTQNYLAGLRWMRALDRTA